MKLQKKLQKRLILPAIILVATLGVTGAIVYGQPDVQPVKQQNRTTSQTADTTPATQTTTESVSPDTETLPAAAPSAPTADDTKAQIHQMVQDFMVSKGADPNTAQDNIDLQVRCLEQMMTNNGVGFDDNATAVGFVNLHFINGVDDGSGVHERILFDGPCRATYVPIN